MAWHTCHLSPSPSQQSKINSHMLKSITEDPTLTTPDVKEEKLDVPDVGTLGHVLAIQLGFVSTRRSYLTHWIVDLSSNEVSP